MAWRGLHISQPCHLSLDKSRIQVDLRGENENQPPLHFPLEDAAWIILDNVRVTLSARLIAACMESGIPIVFSDQRHHPCGMALSFHQHHAQTEVARDQLAMKAGFKKAAWAITVRAKIRNQGENLRLAQHKDQKALQAFAGRVKSGDPDNVEAHAARYYWLRVFDDFARSDSDDLRNAMLNYGYACLRGALARAVTASGFLPAMGIHHDGRFNAFNLVDDMMEPYRPVVDWAVVEHLREREDDLDEMTLHDRRAMAAVLSRDVVIDGEQLAVVHATERTADSLRRAMQENAPKRLLFPKAW